MITHRKINDLRSRFDKFRNEFDRDLKELEKEQAESQENNWAKKILEKLREELPNQDYECCYHYLFVENQFFTHKYYFKAILKWIIQACADLLNTKKIDWSNKQQRKYHFGSSSKKLEFDYYYEFNKGVVCFDSEEHLNQAKEILSNLNSINVLELYYKD